MEIALPQDLEKLVAEQVARGKYPSTSELVREALRDLLAKQDSDDKRPAVLRGDLKIGLEDLEEGRFVDYVGAEASSLASDVGLRGRLRLKRSQD